jgi:hypothetical protein
MFSFVFPKKCSFSSRIGSHNTVVEIYSISTNAVICVFASVVLYSSVEIATFGVTYVYDGPIFIGELICARLSGDVPYSFRVSKSVPCIYYRHNTLLHIFWRLSLVLLNEVVNASRMRFALLRKCACRSLNCDLMQQRF